MITHEQKQKKRLKDAIGKMVEAAREVVEVEQEHLGRPAKKLSEAERAGRKSKFTILGGRKC